MRAKLRWLRVVAFVGVCFGLLLGGEVGQAVAESFLSSDETSMHQLVNTHRGKHASRRALTMNSSLRMIARRQSQRMVAAGFIYHNPDLQKEIQKALPNWLVIGENVGVGPDPKAVEVAFIHSEPHHANIHLRDYNLIGVGAVAGEGGRRFYTQTFAKVTSSGAMAGGEIVFAQAPVTAPDGAVVAEVLGVLTTDQLQVDGDDSGVTLPRALSAMLGRSVQNIGRGLGRLAFWR